MSPHLRASGPDALMRELVRRIPQAARASQVTRKLQTHPTDTFSAQTGGRVLSSRAARSSTSALHPKV